VDAPPEDEEPCTEADEEEADDEDAGKEEAGVDVIPGLELPNTALVLLPALLLPAALLLLLPAPPSAGPVGAASPAPGAGRGHAKNPGHKASTIQHTRNVRAASTSMWPIGPQSSWTPPRAFWQRDPPEVSIPAFQGL